MKTLGIQSEEFIVAWTYTASRGRLETVDVERQICDKPFGSRRHSLLKNIRDHFKLAMSACLITSGPARVQALLFSRNAVETLLSEENNAKDVVGSVGVLEWR
jgi:hypothetical protein